MMLSTLASLGLVLSVSFSGPSTNYYFSQTVYQQNNLTLPVDTYSAYMGELYTMGNTSYVTDYTFSLSYDTNYNEYFNVSVDLNKTDNYVFVSYESWLHNNYNVSLRLSFALYDTVSNTPVLTYFSNTCFLVTSDLSLRHFSGDSDVMNYQFDTSHDYIYDFYVYLDLLQDTDFDDLVNGTYTQGYEDGKTDGENTGYQQGYTDGETEGESTGYQTGYQDGKTDGYTQGYNNALATHDFSFNNLFYAIGDTPILMIRRLFGFEIFGVSLISVFMSLFTALVIIHLIKKVF